MVAAVQAFEDSQQPGTSHIEDVDLQPQQTKTAAAVQAFKDSQQLGKLKVKTTSICQRAEVEDPIIQAVVAELGPVKQYVSGTDKREMREILVCDGTEHLVLRVHKPALLDGFFKVNKSYSFTRLILESGQQRAIIATGTKVFRIPDINVDESKMKELPSLVDLPRIERKRTLKSISEAQTSPQKTKMSIRGKVLKVYPMITKNMRGEPANITNITLVDEAHNTIEIGMFRELARSSQTLTAGMNIQVNDVSATEVHGKKKLSSTDGTCVEHLNDNEIQVTGFEEIADSDEEVDRRRPSVITITGSGFIKFYAACLKPQCNGKKLGPQKDGGYMCPTCFSNVHHGSTPLLGIVMKIQIHQSGSQQTEEVTLFREDALKVLCGIIEDKWSPDIDVAAVEDAFVEKLPLKVIAFNKYGGKMLVQSIIEHAQSTA